MWQWLGDAVIPFAEGLHVVQNHNPQHKNVGSNFVWLTSHLAMNYHPPLGPFSEYDAIQIWLYCLVYMNLYFSLFIQFFILFFIPIRILLMNYTIRYVPICIFFYIGNSILICMIFYYILSMNLYTHRFIQIGMYQFVWFYVQNHAYEFIVSSLYSFVYTNDPVSISTYSHVKNSIFSLDTLIFIPPIFFSWYGASLGGSKTTYTWHFKSFYDVRFW